MSRFYDYRNSFSFHEAPGHGVLVVRFNRRRQQKLLISLALSIENGRQLYPTISPTRLPLFHEWRSPTFIEWEITLSYHIPSPELPERQERPACQKSLRSKGSSELHTRLTLQESFFKEIFFFSSRPTIFYHIPMYQSSHLFASSSAKSETNWAQVGTYTTDSQTATSRSWHMPVGTGSFIALRLRTHRLYEPLLADRRGMSQRQISTVRWICW